MEDYDGQHDPACCLVRARQRGGMIPCRPLKVRIV